MAAARAEIPVVILSEASPTSPVAGAEAYIKGRISGTLSTVYKNSGASNETIAQPLTTDSAGRLTGWLERGAYILEITVPGKAPYTEYLDIAPGVDGSIENSWIANGTISGEKIAASIKDAAAGTASLRTLGTGATQATAGNDSRLTNERVPTDGSVTKNKLAAGIGAFTWYIPKIIAGEESRTNTSFGTLPTADEVTGVELSSNGLIAVVYDAVFKSSITVAGKAAIFIGSNQLKVDGGTSYQVQESSTQETHFAHLVSQPQGLMHGPLIPGAIASTGSALGIEKISPVCLIYVSAGTYNVSVQYRAESGSVTAKERRLYVGTTG